MMACTPLGPRHAATKSVDHTRMDRLIELNDYSERIYAYHRYCIGRKEPIDPQFEQNFEIIVNLLFDEFMKTMRWQPDFTAEQIKGRRHNLQEQLRKHYSDNGCETPEAAEAKEYYRILSGQDRSSIEDYIGGEKPAKGQNAYQGSHLN